MNCEIRQMRVDEIPLIAGIDRSEELREDYVCAPVQAGLGLRLVRRPVEPPRHIPNWSKTELESRFALWRRNLGDGAELIGAFHAEAIVGFVLVTAHSEQNTGEIYSLFADRRHRGRGLGTALLAAAEQHCRRRESATLIVYTGHSAAAVDFYLKHGFRMVGIRDPRFATKGFDLTLAKELRAEPPAGGYVEDGARQP